MLLLVLLLLPHLPQQCLYTLAVIIAVVGVYCCAIAVVIAVVAVVIATAVSVYLSCCYCFVF